MTRDSTSCLTRTLFKRIWGGCYELDPGSGSSLNRDSGKGVAKGPGSQGHGVGPGVMCVLDVTAVPKSFWVQDLNTRATQLDMIPSINTGHGARKGGDGNINPRATTHSLAEIGRSTVRHHAVDKAPRGGKSLDTAPMGGCCLEFRPEIVGHSYTSVYGQKFHAPGDQDQVHRPRSSFTPILKTNFDFDQQDRVQKRRPRL